MIFPRTVQHPLQSRWNQRVLILCVRKRLKLSGKLLKLIPSQIFPLRKSEIPYVVHRFVICVPSPLFFLTISTTSPRYPRINLFQEKIQQFVHACANVPTIRGLKYLPKSLITQLQENSHGNPSEISSEFDLFAKRG